ncbi:hypothetical protein [Lysinibacillus pakistanensis]|uniref:ABC transporter permease n=1 Tax=Lysinibacillus pakistanensis TaxID=759811 RepID=A0AAX3WRQ6_9BACI|nr:hypothetical protein [Lysinibacillus pakistanensis]MDM5229920.1 hypothetical protein [Lysinibacillus pakistanensis]WHY45520.1 hypothetical protein QNH22_19720 [Lysinibacillus pakistanensis]WHY50528.1 hypothetical protein QNH24_19685 [Lysinibacillus pakistanensis]
MKLDELVMLILIYSGLMTFFIVPFDRNKPFEHPCSFSTLFRENLMRLIFHKKTLFAVIFLILLLTGIWFGFKQQEYHINAHSGNPPIHTNTTAIFYMCGLFLYTIVLYLLLALTTTFKAQKNNH